MTKKTARNGRSHVRVNGTPNPDKAIPGVKIAPAHTTGANGSAPTASGMKAVAEVAKAAMDKAVELKTPAAPVDLKAAGRKAATKDGATADAIHKAKPSDVQKEIGPKTRIVLSLPRLKAALAVAAKKDSRAALNGVYLHAEGPALNILATDGCHLIQSCMWRDKDADAWPSYLDKGIILDRDVLAKALAYLGKDEDVKAREQVTFEFADGSASGVLMDHSGDARIRIPLIEGQFPPYKVIVEQAGSALLGGESTPLTSASGIAREYMKAAGVVAAALDAKAVQVVAPVDDRKPWVIVYPGCEGVLHIIMPMKIEVGLGRKTLALIGNSNLKGSMAALKATITMQTRSMEETTSDTAKARHKAVIDSCKIRMKAIEEAMADTTIKLAAPKPEKPAKVAKAPKVRKPKAAAPAQPPKAAH